MRKTKRAVFVPALLRVLQRGIHTTGELASVFCAGYEESYRRARRFAYAGQTSGPHGKDWGDVYLEEQQFYNLLSYLRRQGLVEGTKGEGRQRDWRITRAGKEKLQNARQQAQYAAKKDTTLRVVIFDVPERDKRKRDWLRGVLRAMGFSLLQGSVWIGARKIPEQFLFDMRERDLTHCVHIFEVQNEGSILVER